MEENRWLDIWSKRDDLQNDYLNMDEYELFCELKRIDGFDDAVDKNGEGYRGFYNSFLETYRIITENVGDINSVYEVGCGSGVNLFLFSRRSDNCVLGGCDYASNMVKCARKVVDSDDMIVAEAIDIKESPQYDVVMSESVFQYFPSLEYARDVLSKMIKKARKLVYVGEVSDIEFEEEQLNARRQQIPDYDNRYRGLGRMFYAKAWFEEIAKEHGCRVLFTGIANDKYVNGKYQFNVYILI